jgi:hypothetical protein
MARMASRAMDITAEIGAAFLDSLPGQMRTDARPPAPRRPGRAGAAADPLRDKVMALVQLQRADGSWARDGALEKLVGIDGRAFDTALDALVTTLGLQRSESLARAFATALAIEWLETRAARLRDEWRLVAEKGATALRSLAPGGAAEAWLTAARELM